MNEPEEYKMWLVVRKDLNMPAGKLAVQSGHAFQLLTLEVTNKNPELFAKYYNNQSIVKICVEAKSEDHLLKVVDACSLSNIPVSLVKDAGRTVFAEPTFTVCAFGPWLRSELPSKLKKLKLYGEENVKEEDKQKLS